MVISGQLLAGHPRGQTRIFLWHDGAITDIAPVSTSSSLSELLHGGPSSYRFFLRQARLAPDGKHLEFTSLTGINGYDQRACSNAVGPGCREVYAYSAVTNRLVCASCASGPARVMASVATNELHGGTLDSGHENRGISDDGNYVFFSTAEGLVPGDTNGKSDAYEWRASGVDGCGQDRGCVSLLSTGTSTADSWFLDASASGGDAFFVTRQQLSGWDTDTSYDLYDARIGGGLPEPPIQLLGCSAGTCQGALTAPPAVGSPASEGYSGAGNAAGKLKARIQALRCKRGYVRRTVKGKVKCVKRRAPRARRARAKRRAS